MTPRLPLVLLVYVLFVAAPAQADVAIGPERILVNSDGGAATVIRKPFRMSFSDASGRSVLTEVDNKGDSPLPVPPHTRPELLGTDTVDAPTLYAPLAFMVGAQRTEQHTGSGLWQGNQLVGIEGGTMFSAREVVDAKPKGDGAELTVSTNDPSGRQLIVDILPEGDTIHVTAKANPPEGVAVMADAFASGTDEAFHGFGGRHNAIDQRGRDFYNWIEEENFPWATGGSQPEGDALSNSQEGGAEGDGGALFPNGPTAAYYVQPLFVSSRPYGFLLRQTEISYFRLASDRPDAWQTAVAAPMIDYTVAAGDGPQAVKSLTAINGRHRVPPEWAVGPQTTRLVKPGQAFNSDEHEGLIRDDLKKIDKYGVPIDGYDMFGWQVIMRRGPGPQRIKDLIGEFHKRGIKVTAYFPPFVERGDSGYTNQDDYQDVIAKGLGARTAAGTPFIFSPTPLLGYSGILLDFTNPDTVKWWDGKVREALDLGFDGFMQDFGEQVQTEMQFANGDDGATMHNKYPLIYHKVTRELFDRYEREHPGRELWYYTRSGFGTAGDLKGSAAYESGNFPGDNSADWSHSNGLASAAPDMLSRVIGGAYGYTTDIGGYTGDTPKELFIRWAEWATLSPYMRLHNSSSNDTRQPWFYDDATVKVWNELGALRRATRPLILELWKQSQDNGMPPTRPLWLQFPGDKEAARQQQEWMLGPDILVAPVVAEGATKRKVYFPDGCWQQEGTGERFKGPAYATVAAPLESLPWFTRCGIESVKEAAQEVKGDRASGGSRCLPRKMTVGLRGIDQLRIGDDRDAMIRKQGFPFRRSARTFRYCVKGGGRVLVAFSPKGRARLIATVSAHHQARRVARGRSAKTLFRAYRGQLVRMQRGLYRTTGRTRKLFAIRRGKVRFVAVANRELLSHRRTLTRYLRLMRL